MEGILSLQYMVMGRWRVEKKPCRKYNSRQGLWLGHRDSNPDRQSQNLQSYR